MNRINLVTGANGHLGNNVVRALLDRGLQVRACVRDIRNRESLDGLDCELVQADLLDAAAIPPTLEDVDTLYQVAASFKQWARDPQREILEANLKITRNILEAAAAQGVRRIIYVSSEGALDDTVSPVNETHWKTEYRGNTYWQSKTESERLALNMADDLDLDLVSVLPGAIIGPNCYRLTPTMKYLQQALDGEVFIDIDFYFNFVDVRDVVAGMIAAADNGGTGERYLLANRQAVGTRRVLEIAQEFNPQIKLPPRVPRSVLIAMGTAMDLASRITSTEPKMTRSQAVILNGNIREMDISKAKDELGFNPRDPEIAIRETFEYLSTA